MSSETSTTRRRRTTAAATQPLDPFDQLMEQFRPYAVLQLQTAQGQREPVFTTDATGLYELYLASLPKPQRQHHTCSCCKRFIERYGGLVRITPEGKLMPIFWNAAMAGAPYTRAITRLALTVANARVTGVFVTSEKVWGEPVNVDMKRGVTWSHFAVEAPACQHFRQPGELPHQHMAKRFEGYQTVKRAITEFTPAVLQAAMALLQTESLSRSESVIGPVRWLQETQAAFFAAPASRGATQQENLLWRRVALAPEAFLHPRSSMAGTLLEDLASGLPTAQVQRRFAEKMAPGAYQRAVAAPAAGAVQQAEKLFNELQLAPALARRYATLADLPREAVLWSSRPIARKPAPEGGLFSHLSTREQRPAPARPGGVSVPAQPITWEKFRATVLPHASRIEALVPASADPFMALVTAEHAEAPPLLAWDREDARNPVSWYYAGGVDAEIRRRVLREGGRVDNVEVRFSLAWNNGNDLDLHVLTPDGRHIFYGDKRPHLQQGWLDVDMNAGGAVSLEPVENIRWPTGTAPSGRYRVYANLYTTHGYPAQTPFTVELEVGGQVFTRHGVVHIHNSGNRLDRMVPVADFIYQRGQPVQLASDAAPRPASNTPNAWGLTPGSFAPVRAVVSSPNLWGERPMAERGSHAFFLLEGCRDSQEGVGRGFFTEQLRPELRPVRSVMEAYSASAPIAGGEQAEACGLGISRERTGNLTVRVALAGGEATYTIDRWD